MNLNSAILNTNLINMNLDGAIDEPSSYMFCQTVQYKDCKEDKDPEKIMLDSRASYTMTFY
jgi:hypothetical protein